MEGHGFQCSLYKDGKKIGIVSDYADGGSYFYELDKGEEKILDAHCKTLPKRQLDEFELDMNSDMFVYDLVMDFKDKKQMRTWCRKKTVFYIDGDNVEIGGYRNISHKFDQSVKEHLEKKYKDKGLVIMNETI